MSYLIYLKKNIVQVNNTRHLTITKYINGLENKQNKLKNDSRLSGTQPVISSCNGGVLLLCRLR